MLTVEVQGLETVQNQLRRLAERGANLTPLLKNMGEQVLNSTQERFESSTDPDGNRWASNSPVPLHGFWAVATPTRVAKSTLVVCPV